MSSNKLLSRLSRADSRLIEPHLEAVDLPVRRQLEVRKKRIDHVYFLDRGLASVVADGGDNIEIGMIGREGMTGLSVVLDGDADNRALLRYAHAFMKQTAQTALAMGAARSRSAWRGGC